MAGRSEHQTYHIQGLTSGAAGVYNWYLDFCPAGQHYILLAGCNTKDQDAKKRTC